MLILPPEKIFMGQKNVSIPRNKSQNIFRHNKIPLTFSARGIRFGRDDSFC